ncbi:unnamed protein product [Rotaria sp. Silwood2]|nr:unnamed protein product [Rotaria sp. Silwood2]
MATATSNQKLDYPIIVRKFMHPSFLDDIIKNVSDMLEKMKFIDRCFFREYADFIRDVKRFKESLLKFILESKIQLSVLKDNFQKSKYKQADQHRKLEFIKERLDRIQKETLFDYLTACNGLIKRSIELHEKYGSTLFKVKYIVLHLLGFTIAGAIAGFTIGLVIPFCGGIEACVGAGVGALIGLAYVTYKLIVNWKDRAKKIEVIQENLKETQRALEYVLKNMKSVYIKLGEAKDELQNQSKNDSFQEIDDLENYVLATLDSFNVLEEILSKPQTHE